MLCPAGMSISAEQIGGHHVRESGSMRELMIRGINFREPRSCFLTWICLTQPDSYLPSCWDQMSLASGKPPTKWPLLPCLVQGCLLLSKMLRKPRNTLSFDHSGLVCPPETYTWDSIMVAPSPLSLLPGNTPEEAWDQFFSWSYDQEYQHRYLIVFCWRSEHKVWLLEVLLTKAEKKAQWNKCSSGASHVPDFFISFIPWSLHNQLGRKV